ncbi:MAG: hypothetical protein HY056_06975 [Proteobacteria bacterium]|nr:hypothetical protein [Pseudomonadota bacterium]
MISVTGNGMGIPPQWTLLPTARNSHNSQRTELLDRLRAAFPDKKFAELMGDREFIGNAWMTYLQRQNIPIHLTLARESARPARGLCRHVDFRHRAASQNRGKNDRQGRLPARPPRRDIVRAAAPRGDAARVRQTVSVACFGRAHRALARYRQCWTIETMFGNHKTKGFALEATHLTNPGKLCTLLGLMAFAVADGENRRRHGAPACNSKQKTRSACAVTIRSRPEHAPQNLRCCKS